MASSAWCGIGERSTAFVRRNALITTKAWLRAEVGKRERSASSLTLAKDRQFSIPRQTWRRHGTTGLLGEEQNQS
jgi:hypothetical protein